MSISPARKPSSKRAAIMQERTRRHRESAARTMDGFVRTPAELAEYMCTAHPELGSFPRGARVLEPSAGDGALVRWILDADSDVHVVAVEPNSERADGLHELAKEFPGRVTVHCMTFETFALSHTGGHLGDVEPFDAVVMNPPFGDSSRDLVWMDHIRIALDLLRPGAQLVSIVPNGYGHRSDKAHKAFREWAAERGARHEQLPRDAFAASGCGVSAGLLTLVKPLPARPDGLPLWLAVPAISEPVHVGRYPLVTASAALATPVQVFGDGWDGGRDQTLCFVGTCFACHRPLWWVDGRPGALPYHGFTLDADESGETGPSVLLCLGHYTHGDPLRADAITAAQPYWSAGTGIPAGPRILPGDLCEGLWVEVTFNDAQGGVSTEVGQLLADPVDGGDGRVTLRMRNSSGRVRELIAEWDAPVNLIGVDVPAATGPRTPTPACARPSAVTANGPAGGTPTGTAGPAETAAVPPVGGEAAAQLDIWGPLIDASNR